MTQRSYRFGDSQLRIGGEPIPDGATLLDPAAPTSVITRWSGEVETRRDLGQLARFLRRVRWTRLLANLESIIPSSSIPKGDVWGLGEDLYAEPSTRQLLIDEARALDAYEEPFSENRLRRIELARWADDGGAL